MTTPRLIAVWAWLASACAFGQKAWTPPRTADGQPDLQGIWTNANLTPFERPAEFAGKAFFTPQEAAAFEKRRLNELDADRRDSNPTEDVRSAYNNVWWGWGNKVASTLRTSLVIDPPDGRVPALTPEAQQRRAARVAALEERCKHTVCALDNARVPIPVDGPEDRPLTERCIFWSTAGPPLAPSTYNNNYQIVQGPGYVAILSEMIHDVRVIPLDGRAHLSGNVRQWLGDSRGHWENNTLVVETTNFTGATAFRGSTENLRLVERFTRTAPDTIVYEFTAEDPHTWTRPWTAQIPMTRMEGPIIEYACNEGNYGMTGILAGARAQEK